MAIPLVSPSSRWGRAMVLAVVVEAMALAGAGWLSFRPLPPLPVRDEISLDLTTLPPPEMPKPPDAEPPKSEPVKAQPAKPEPVKARPPKMHPKAAPKPPAPPLQAVASSGPVSNAPSDFATAPPVPPAEPPPPAASEPANAAVLDLFQAKARAAVQAALRYPNAARIRRLTGQCRLTFDYRDGQVSSLRIATSSGYDVLDEAAIAALTDAALPAAPPEYAGHLLRLTIAVVFAAQP